MKFCRKCQIETERYSRGQCKLCVKKNAAAWKSANPEKVKAKKTEWAKANSEKMRAYFVEWRSLNHEKERLKSAAWRDSNPEKSKAASDAWKKKNPEANRIHKQNRKARKQKNGGVLSRDLSERLLKLQKGKCACCGKPLGKKFHLDHIMPIALGGLNVDENIQLLRAKCNAQKHAKHPVDFMQSRGFLL